MAFPEGWPPGASTTHRSFRFHKSETTTALFEDNAWLFSSAASANQPLPYVRPGDTSPVVVPVNYGGGRNVNDVGMGVPVPPARYSPRFILIWNDSANTTDVLEWSYDGVNVHGWIHGGEFVSLEDVKEGGIAIRHASGSGAFTFRVNAW